MEPSLYIIKAILILDNDGNRLLAKYYDDQSFQNLNDQKSFEKTLFKRTHKANGDIIMLDGLTIVYRSNVDLFFYVVGSTLENEIILVSILNCLFESLAQIMRKQRGVEKRYLLKYMNLVHLAVDEICDSGVLLEIDASQVVKRVCLKENDVPLSEQTLHHVLKSAKEQIKTSMFK
jgi:hypothetical protein